jgi:hypothetical protein
MTMTAMGLSVSMVQSRIFPTMQLLAPVDPSLHFFFPRALQLFVAHKIAWHFLARVIMFTDPVAFLGSQRRDAEH